MEIFEGTLLPPAGAVVDVGSESEVVTGLAASNDFSDKLAGEDGEEVDDTFAFFAGRPLPLPGAFTLLFLLFVPSSSSDTSSLELTSMIDVRRRGALRRRVDCLLPCAYQSIIIKIIIYYYRLGIFYDSKYDIIH